MEEVGRIQNDIILQREKKMKLADASWKSYLPAIFVFAGAFLMLFGRIEIGGSFVGDGALMMLALACYLLAALFQLTNLYAPSEMAQKIGLWTGTLGVFFNLASWLVRWVGAYDREIAMLRAGGNMATPWFFRYIPFANLYDLSLAFAFGAGIVTLLIAHRKNLQFLSAFTMPLCALILTLARFIGDEFIDLPPVLDSYWRPIHVGTASLSYGVALVCFAVAVIYLIKDKVKVEGLAIWSSVFAVAVIGTVSKFSVFTEFVYRTGTFVPNPQGGKAYPGFFRFEVPYVGATLVHRRITARRHDSFVSRLSLSEPRNGQKNRRCFAQTRFCRADCGDCVSGFGCQIFRRDLSAIAVAACQKSVAIRFRRQRDRIETGTSGAAVRGVDGDTVGINFQTVSAKFGRQNVFEPEHESGGIIGFNHRACRNILRYFIRIQNRKTPRKTAVARFAR